MYVCNYCNRVLKQEYEKCPGCGGTSFKNKAYLGEIVIETPPEGGYKLNVDNYKRALKNANILILVGTLMCTLPIVFTILFLFVFTIFLNGALIAIILGIILIIWGNSYKKTTKKSLDKATKLATTGILVKSMPYQVINTGTMVMGTYYKCIKVNYKNSAGIEIPLYSETKYDIEEKKDKNKTVDLLIDADDYSNYFIDYEIF